MVLVTRVQFVVIFVIKTEKNEIALHVKAEKQWKKRSNRRMKWNILSNLYVVDID